MSQRVGSRPMVQEFFPHEDFIMSTDKQLQKDVIGRLETELGNWVSGVGVAVTDGTVMLSGTAPTCTAKYAAERAALRVPGVRAVFEEVRVGEAGEHGDGEIAKTVARALEQDPSVPANVQATVEGGSVMLQGEVNSTSQKDAALNAVRHLAGVGRIYNLITIKPAE
jgi:osmotically-inducible protein OsmY